MKPHSHEEHIQHSFDAFCKKVLRNEARDYQDEQARKRNREISFSDLPVEVMEQLSVCDIYLMEDKTFGVLDYAVYIDNDEIAALPLDKRDIILLSYFLDMSDNEIAKLLNMVRSSVTYRRSSTLKLLKELMGGNTDDT
jgi:DNA-directed RNA polymerase specialized sigma24 family protein